MNRVTTLQPVPLPVRVGDTVLDRYRVEEILGAIGSVWYVRASYNLAPQLGYSIQILPAHQRHGQRVRDYFLHEASRIESLPTPPFIPVIRSAMHEDGHACIIREFFESCNFQDTERLGPPSVIKAMRVAECVAKAMSQAHRLGRVMHGFTPYDVMLSLASGPDQVAAYILQGPFGIDEVCEDDVRMQGYLAQFHPPEFIQHRQGSVASDVHALGMLLSAMLFGRRLGEALADFESFNFENYEAFRDPIFRALAKDPSERFPSVHSFMTAARGAAWRVQKSAVRGKEELATTRVFARR